MVLLFNVMNPIVTQMETNLCINFPARVSAYIKKVMGRLEKEESQEAKNWHRALALQFLPSQEEQTILPCELADPLGAAHHQASARMVHQYKNRVLILTTSHCFAHCRYCFRKNYISNAAPGSDWSSPEEVAQMCQYLAAHPEVKEALLSGGDPMTAPFDQLQSLIASLRTARPNLLIRLCTRGTVFHPTIFSPQLVEKLKKLKPLWVIPHINHLVEISPIYAPESRDALCLLVDAGIPVQSQTVLLRGVNDEVGTLAQLFQDLTNLGVKPGYLFQCDMVAGTSHLRVPVEEGLKLYHQLRQELSGLSTPVYAVDLPDGGGKFNLLELDSTLSPTQVQRLEESYQFTKADGSVWYYPR